jgi:hypothetical protein
MSNIHVVATGETDLIIIRQPSAGQTAVGGQDSVNGIFQPADPLTHPPSLSELTATLVFTDPTALGGKWTHYFFARTTGLWSFGLPMLSQTGPAVLRVASATGATASTAAMTIKLA